MHSSMEVAKFLKLRSFLWLCANEATVHVSRLRSSSFIEE